MSFFLYIYRVKVQFTILLFFISTISLLAYSTPKKDGTKKDINSTVVSNTNNDTSGLTSSTITNDADGGGLSDDKEGSLNSILGYSILIFFSVLIIILIENRNLERRYKKMLSDFKSKEPTL